MSGDRDDEQDNRQLTALVNKHQARFRESVELRRFGLEVIEGPHKGRVFRSEGERCVIGAHPSSDLIIDDETVSRFHCELLAAEDGVRIRDLGSKNGTVVDGVRISDAFVRDQSRVQLGTATVRFSLGDGSVKIPLSSEPCFGELVGESEAMRSVFGLLARSARTESTVLIEGETGTGKEGAAHAIHSESTRAEGPFVVVDCGAIPENLIESELFGHEKGAFTGAVARHTGAFEQADGGTIFLDEIGELPTDLQPKLLRVLEQKTIRRVGSNDRQRVNVRIVAATNRDLRREVNEGRFRSDLYFRLSVLKVVLPPLRARADDFFLLTRALLERIGAKPEQVTRFTAIEFIDRLRHNNWPGNVRELRNYLERCLVMDAELPLTEGQIESSHLTAVSADAGTSLSVDVSLPYTEARQQAIADFERVYLKALLDKHAGNVSQASREAGIDRVYLHRLIRRHAIKD